MAVRGPEGPLTVACRLAAARNSAAAGSVARSAFWPILDQGAAAIVGCLDSLASLARCCAIFGPLRVVGSPRGRALAQNWPKGWLAPCGGRIYGRGSTRHYVRLPSAFGRRYAACARRAFLSPVAFGEGSRSHRLTSPLRGDCDCRQHTVREVLRASRLRLRRCRLRRRPTAVSVGYRDRSLRSLQGSVSFSGAGWLDVRFAHVGAASRPRGMLVACGAS